MVMTLEERKGYAPCLAHSMPSISRAHCRFTRASSLARVTGHTNNMKCLLFFLLLLWIHLDWSNGGEQMVEADVALDPDQLQPIKPKAGKSPEDSIPVIEIRGEGKPMTAAQIRALEEESEGKPMDIKVKHTWRPKKCPRAAKRKDFITFHYKGFLEGGKKFDQSYGRGPVRIQLGVGMIMPGLDKGLKGMCDTELRKINVPWRLSRKKKSKMWKYIPNEEHWLVFDIEMLTVEAWTPQLQFEFMDSNNDSSLTVAKIQRHVEMLRKEFGKHWSRDDIDSVSASKYFVSYFDSDGNNKVSLTEYEQKMRSDQRKMSSVRKKPEGRKRDPGVAWILDFNNDGIVTRDELDQASQILEHGPEALNLMSSTKEEL